MKIEEMSEMELKAALFDLDQEIKQRQQAIQQLAIQLQKKQQSVEEVKKDDGKPEDISKDN